MKIVFTKFPLESHFGGGEKHTMQLARELQAIGHKVYLLSSDPILIPAWQKEGWPYRKINVGIEPTSPKGLLSFTLRLPITILQFRYWATRLKQRGVSVVYAQSLTEKLLFTPWLIRAGIAVFWMEHLQIENWLKLNPYRWLYRRLSKEVTIITVSQGVAQQLIDFGIDKQRVKVIYNGIDTTTFSPETTPVRDKSPIVFGTAARIAIEKDISTVLQALALLKKQGLSFKYRIAGTGDQLNYLKVLTKQLKLESEVEFVGFIEDVKAFLVSLDVFVLTSFRRESFGIAVAEAMAMGKPAIVTDITGLREVVKEGETGLIIPVKNIKRLAEAMTTMIQDTDKRLAMGKASRQRVVEYFGQDKMVQAFIDLFTHKLPKSAKERQRLMANGIKIGIDIQSTLGKKTGFGFYVANLVNGLQKVKGDDETVLIKPNRKDDFSTPQRLFWDQITLPRLSGKAEVNVLHQPGFSVPLFYSGKTVATIHDLVAIFLGRNLPFWPRQFFARWVPFTFRFADHLIAVSHQTKADTVRLLGIPEERITVIHEAADEAYRVIDDLAEIERVKKRYDIGNEPFFLHIGTLEPRKNLEFLVRAFALAKKDPSLTAKLVISGKKGWYYQGLFSLVESLNLQDEVHFTGYIETADLPVLYNAATVFVWPSQYEGFGLPPLEAMASGIPVISSNTSSMPEVVGDAGILLPITDETVWAKAMTKVMGDAELRQELRAKGLAQAKKFSWERCAKETLAVYHQVLGEDTL